MEDDIWDEWPRAARDPEKSVGAGRVKVFLLAIEVPVEFHGVFPSIDEERESTRPQTSRRLSPLGSRITHSSTRKSREPKECERYVEDCYSIKVRWDDCAKGATRLCVEDGVARKDQAGRHGQIPIFTRTLAEGYLNSLTRSSKNHGHFSWPSIHLFATPGKQMDFGFPFGGVQRVLRTPQPHGRVKI